MDIKEKARLLDVERRIDDLTGERSHQETRSDWLVEIYILSTKKSEPTVESRILWKWVAEKMTVSDLTQLCRSTRNHLAWKSMLHQMQRQGFKGDRESYWVRFWETVEGYLSATGLELLNPLDMLGSTEGIGNLNKALLPKE